MDFKKLSTQAKDLVEKRGGTEGLKRDAGQLREIAKQKGSLSDKAKAAAAALKETGANDPAQPAADADPPPAAAPKPDPAAPTALGGDLDAEAAARKAEHRKKRAGHKAGRDDPAP
ncbi:MAG: hypothetical protein M3331_04025 [Actinomycetota bacterium]|nr:hypothetical protein [Actinomycetota bacterium]